MARWRDTKSGKQTLSKETSSSQTKKNIEISASLLSRSKAMVTDTFMIIMPIMYIVVYLVMGSGEMFSQNILLGWSMILIPYMIITILFLMIKGQTPGLKAYELKIVTSIEHKKLDIYTATVRYVIYILSIISIFGIFIPFFREDKKTLQDLVANTTVIVFPNKN